MFKKFLLIIGLIVIFNQSANICRNNTIKKACTKYKRKRKETACRCLRPLQKPSTKKVIKKRAKTA